MNISRNSTLNSEGETPNDGTKTTEETTQHEDNIIKGGLKDVFGRTYSSPLAKKSLDIQLHNHLLNNYYSAMAVASPAAENEYRSFSESSNNQFEELEVDIEGDDEDLSPSQTGHLSFANPNYRGNHSLESHLVEDHINCNTLYEELKQVGAPKMLHNSTMVIPTTGSPTSRKAYADLDISSMGVDLHKGPTTEREEEIESAKLLESETEKGNNTVIKLRPKKIQPELPQGWEKHEDKEGPYFWHVKSGIISRDPPSSNTTSMESEEEESRIMRNIRSSKIFDDDFVVKQPLPCQKKASLTKSCTSSSIVDMAKGSFESSGESMVDRRDFSSAKDSDSTWKRRSLPLSSIENGRIMQVTVISLGWVELGEEELTPENSSKAVNRCIIELSSINEFESKEPLGQWGGGKELSLILDERSLKLVSEDDNLLLNSQPIHTIRVWGVGRDNGHDFAYVARDRHSRKHMCHVFRCDKQARSIANALRDICKKILIERSLAQSSSKLTTSTSSILSTDSGKIRTSDRVRPTSLGSKLLTKSVPAPESFPTPMEEPRKSIKASYLGSATVPKPCGMDIINDTIDSFLNDVPRSEWKKVMVSVAPSTVSVSYMDGRDPLEYRVRFLSFLGIGLNPQQCAFIVHTAQDTFVCHVFHCDPTAGPLCKTIEAACKLRYQKCLDARPQGLSPPSALKKSISTPSLNSIINFTSTTTGSFLSTYREERGFESDPDEDDDERDNSV
ncbi:APBB2 [Lepeophtheirus salmonis]|uniref:APBB2 n=1 Tax=Lepeophtheirus salmonis TaxID=72036 RepID=A0A7R8HEE1_LEPSM|nr:APBB2 [Lepeophtheirus salmonis]CAF3027444.1 APBB2 [Lepeophtheirus salmonis]